MYIAAATQTILPINNKQSADIHSKMHSPVFVKIMKIHKIISANLFLGILAVVNREEPNIRRIKRIYIARKQ